VDVFKYRKTILVGVRGQITNRCRYIDKNLLSIRKTMPEQTVDIGESWFTSRKPQGPRDYADT